MEINPPPVCPRLESVPGWWGRGDLAEAWSMPGQGCCWGDPPPLPPLTSRGARSLLPRWQLRPAAVTPPSLSPSPVILAWGTQARLVATSGITHSMEPKLASPRGRWKNGRGVRGVGFERGEERDSVARDTDSGVTRLFRKVCFSLGPWDVAGDECLCCAGTVVQASCSCSPSAPSASGEARHRVGARWWDLVDERTSPTLLGFPTCKSKPRPEPWSRKRSPKSFELCRHVSWSDHRQFEGIRKPLTFTHGARFPLQLYPRICSLGVVKGRKYASTKTFLPLHHFLLFLPRFWAAPRVGGGEGVGCKASHHLLVGPFRPCPSRKGKQLELWAARWLCLFWAEDGISSVGGSDLFLPCNVKHQLRLALGKGEDGSVSSQGTVILRCNAMKRLHSSMTA